MIRFNLFKDGRDKILAKFSSLSIISVIDIVWEGKYSYFAWEDKRPLQIINPTNDYCAFVLNGEVHVVWDTHEVQLISSYYQEKIETMEQTIRALTPPSAPY